MQIACFRASEFGNGARVADERRRIMAGRGIAVRAQHLREAHPDQVPRADLYVLSSAGRHRKPTKIARAFLNQVRLPPGTR